MRLISWDGRRDVSYENCYLVINPKTFEIEAITSNTDFEPVMGIYSTEAKALKAMEMLREQYMKLGMIKILASGTCEYMDKSLEKEEKMGIYADYCRKHCFKFPKDEDVEV